MSTNWGQVAAKAFDLAVSRQRRVEQLEARVDRMRAVVEAARALRRENDDYLDGKIPDEHLDAAWDNLVATLDALDAEREQAA